MSGQDFPTKNTDVGTLPKKVGPQDFERIKLIGQGDVGKVYLVRLKDDKPPEKKTHFAMKVLSKQEMISRNKLKRCLTEREILATVDYPFIVTLYYCFQSPDHLFLVMDYCAGGEFFRMLKSQPERRIPEVSCHFLRPRAWWCDVSLIFTGLRAGMGPLLCS